MMIRGWDPDPKKTGWLLRIRIERLKLEGKAIVARALNEYLLNMKAKLN